MVPSPSISVVSIWTPWASRIITTLCMNQYTTVRVWASKIASQAVRAYLLVTSWASLGGTGVPLGHFWGLIGWFLIQNVLGHLKTVWGGSRTSFGGFARVSGIFEVSGLFWKFWWYFPEARREISSVISSSLIYTHTLGDILKSSLLALLILLAFRA